MWQKNQGKYHSRRSTINFRRYQRTQIGLVLRQAWFINGCFVNSKVWSGYTDSDLKDLEVNDHDILRAITGAQAKVPTEMLYLETAEVPVKSVIIVRRLLYLQTILQGHKSELTRQIYKAMKEDPIKDDWIHLVLNYIIWHKSQSLRRPNWQTIINGV